MVQGNLFVHRVEPATIKWMARLRTGCLATRMRLVNHGMVESTACLCCGAAVEDEEHLLTGCEATGSSEWQASLLEVWRAAAQTVQADVPDPPPEWLEAHRFMLLAALLPADLEMVCAVSKAVAPRFLPALHKALAASTAERFRRREVLHSEAALPAPSPAPQSPLAPETGDSAAPLPPERRLTTVDLRRVERDRRAAGPQEAAAPSSTTPVIPAAGESRRRWLRSRLEAMLRDDVDACALESGVEAVVLLELFERLTGEPFSETPGMLLTARTWAFAKVLGNLSREATFDPPLQSRLRRSLLVWNRVPRVQVDVAAWRRQQQSTEARAAPVPRLRDQMASTDAGLAAWLVNHPYLLPAASAAAGESGMALLILWEVDHDRPFPSQGGSGLTEVLVGFTRRLQHRVAQDPRLAWLESEDVALPLDRGLAPSHHRRWAVRIASPAQDEPQ